MGGAGGLIPKDSQAPAHVTPTPHTAGRGTALSPVVSPQAPQTHMGRAQPAPALTEETGGRQNRKLPLGKHPRPIKTQMAQLSCSACQEEPREGSASTSCSGPLRGLLPAVRVWPDRSGGAARKGGLVALQKGRGSAAPPLSESRLGALVSPRPAEAEGLSEKPGPVCIPLPEHMAPEASGFPRSPQELVGQFSWSSGPGGHAGKDVKV